MMKKIFVCLFVLVFFVACSGSSDNNGAPPVPAVTKVKALSVKDAQGKELSATASTTGVDPTSFTIKFDRKVSEVVPSIVHLTCDKFEPGLTSSSVGDDTLKFLATDAWKYGKLNCTLEVSSRFIMDAGDFVENAKYLFTSACATGDDFNATTIANDSSSCWGVKLGEVADSSYFTKWEDLSKVISIKGGVFVADFTGVKGKGTEFYKDVSVGQNYEIEVHVNKFLNTEINDVTGVYLKDKLSSASDFDRLIQIGMFNAGPPMTGIVCGVMAADNNSSGMVAYTHDCSDTSKGYYVKFNYTDGKFGATYRPDNSEKYVDLTESIKQGDLGPNFFNFGAVQGGLVFFNVVAGAGSAKEYYETDFIRVNGITAAGQY